MNLTRGMWGPEVRDYISFAWKLRYIKIIVDNFKNYEKVISFYEIMKTKILWKLRNNENYEIMKTTKICKLRNNESYETMKTTKLWKPRNYENYEIMKTTKLWKPQNYENYEIMETKKLCTNFSTMYKC